MRRLGGTFSHLLDELVRERTGLASSRRHEDAKQRVLGRAMERAGVSDEAVYLALLRRDPRAYDDLIADLTVPETYFFRDAATYALLRREVLPAIVAAREPTHTLEVWSAGCASGEEPYSLAILLEQERLEQRSNVLGTDVSHRALARAREGLYSRWSLRATEERDRARYFEVAGRDYRLIERIRARACFRQHSLSSGAYPLPQNGSTGFDLILCRNVLIYFDGQAMRETAQRLARSLREDGWLLLGPSDPLLEIEEWCDRVPSPCGMLYHRRITGAAHDQPSNRHARALPAQRPTALASTRLARPPAPPLYSELRALPVPSPAPRAGDSALAAQLASHDQPTAPSATEQVLLLAREHGSAAAEAGCRDLLTRQPLAAGLHVVHASLLLDLGRDEAAAQALRRAQYLDRSLPIAMLLAATLAERRAARDEALRSYEQLRQACRAEPADRLVPLGEGLTFGALQALAEQRANALCNRPAGRRP
jgi:chemotaxis protein methyltransferase CheR